MRNFITEQQTANQSELLSGLTTFYYSLILIAWTLVSFQFFSIGNFGVTSIDLVLGCFYLYVLKRLLWDGITLRFTLHLPMMCLLAVLPAVLLSGLTPIIEGVGFIQFSKTFLHFLFVWIFAVLVAGLDDLPEVFARAIRAFMVWGLIVALFGIYQVFARAFDLPLAWVEVTNVSIYYAREGEIQDQVTDQLALQFENFYRATSIFSEPSILAAYMSLVLMFLSVPFLQGKPMFFRSKIMNWAILLACGACIFLTFSMTGFASLAVLLLTVLLIEKGKSRLRVLYGMLAMGLVIFAVDSVIKPVTKVSVIDLFAKRIGGILGTGLTPYSEGISGESLKSRQLTLRTGIEVWQEYPINGIGVGRFSQSASARRADISFSDSTFFSALAETGIVGFLCVFGLFVSLYLLALFWMKHRHFCSIASQRFLGVMPYLLGLTTLHNLTGNSFALPGVWVFLGLMLAACNRAQGETGGRRLEFRLVREPWQTRFTRGLQTIRRRDGVLDT